jgi:MFS family permease
VVWTVGLALLVDTVGQKDIGQTLGWTSISMGVAILVAPLLGGVVYAKAGYYQVYYMAFALIALDIVLRLALIEKKIAHQWLQEDTSELEAVQEPNHPKATRDLRSPDSPEGEKSVEVAPEDNQCATPFEIKRSKWPPMFTLLKSKRLLTALWSCIVQGSQMTAFDSVIPLFVQETFHWGSEAAGLVFLAIIVPGFVAPLVGWVSDKYGPRWLTVIGFLGATPFWVLLRLVNKDTLGQKVLLCALLALIGLALTLVMPPLMAEITYVIEAKERQQPGRFGKSGAYAQAYGLFITAFAAGTLIGPIWSGYVRDAAGWGTMTLSLGSFSVAGAIPCLIWTGGLITKNNPKSGEERAVGRSSGVPASSLDTAENSAV